MSNTPDDIIGIASIPKDQHERVEGAMKLILDKSGIKIK